MQTSSVNKSTICCTHSLTDVSPAFNTRSGFSGGSNGASIPVKPLISPARAFLYSPLTSRFSQTERGVSTKSSKKGRFASS